MKKPHMKLVIKDGLPVWWCNGWTSNTQIGAWIMWWYDGDRLPK